MVGIFPAVAQRRAARAPHRTDDWHRTRRLACPSIGTHSACVRAPNAPGGGTSARARVRARAPLPPRGGGARGAGGQREEEAEEGAATFAVGDSVRCRDWGTAMWTTGRVREVVDG
eukprot:gene18844-21090_t